MSAASLKRLFIALLLSLFVITVYSQVYIVIPLTKAMVPEHGFLPGKKFTFYPTINKYDFTGRQFRVEVYDQRDSLQIKKLDCSKVDITNESEFAGQSGAMTVVAYFQQLLPQAGIIVDSTTTDTLKVYLEALDARLIGFGSITAHGLCEMRMKCKDLEKSYCIDFTDKNPHSPISKNAFITRKTATRVITSAAIREAIEQFFIDLKAAK